MAAKIVAMTALAVFANSQIVNRRPGAPRSDTVGIGDPFEAPWHVARDLALGGLAKADDPAELDAEPTDDLDPHPSISVSDLGAANTRRRRARGDVDPGVTTDVTKPAAVTGDMLQRAPAPGPAALAAGAPVAVASATGAKSNAPATPPKPAA